MNKFVNIHRDDQVLIRCSGCIGADTAERRQFCRNVEFFEGFYYSKSTAGTGIPRETRQLSWKSRR